jgi:hypothetical protein
MKYEVKCNSIANPCGAREFEEQSNMCLFTDSANPVGVLDSKTSN